jgi:opacity protein-like surface antigen
MTMKNTIKTIAFASCMLPIAFNAIAEENKTSVHLDGKNFALIKVGVTNTVAGTNNANVSSVDSGYIAGIELGRKITDVFAVGVEYNYKGKTNFVMTDSPYSDGVSSYTWGARSDTIMFNVSADLMQNSKITPYVKLGAGISRNASYNYVTTDTKTSGKNNITTYPGKSTTNFAWQAGFGFNVDHNERISTDISYSFMNRGKVKTKEYFNTKRGGVIPRDAKSVRIRDHAIAIGLKIKF